MKLAVIILSANLYFLYKGIFRPYFGLLAYLWLGCLYPGAFLPDPFRTLPLPLISMAVAVGSYLIVGPRRFPQLSVVYSLLLAFAFWVTCSTFLWAALPADALVKWSWAVKSVGFPLLMPFFFRTRLELESVVLVVLFAFSAHLWVASLKVLHGGGGYGTLASLVRDNGYLGESSTLATIAIACVPLAIYVAFHSLATGGVKFQKLSATIYILMALAAMIGTSARAGLLALGAYLLLAVRRIWHKLLLCGCAALIGYLILPYLPSNWTNRMQTIETYDQDQSAEGRFKVWAWTYQYAKGHPEGGGFDIYKTEGFESGPIAFHSIYFELLGEQGFVGLGLYVLIMGGTLIGLYRMSTTSRGGPGWVRHLSRAVGVSLVVYSVGGAFIGVAYQPLAYIWSGIYLCLRQAMTENSPETAEASQQAVPTCHA